MSCEQVCSEPDGPGGIRLVATAGIVALTLAACLGPGRTMVEVDMVDGGPWAVTPEVLRDAEVAFRLTNSGANAHQPVVVLTNMPPGEFPVDEGTVDLAGIHIFWPGEGDFAETPDEGFLELLQMVEPGGTIEDAPRAHGEGHPGFGTYIVFCFLPGHYEQGEYGVFEMIEASS